MSNYKTMSIPTLDSLGDLSQKRVLLRVDFNVPLDTNGVVMDDTRIKSALSSIQYLCTQNVKLIIMSHLGRPSTLDASEKKKLSLLPVVNHLRTLVDFPIFFIETIDFTTLPTFIEQQTFGTIFFLENIRFFPEEEQNGISFSKSLASLADIYVNDAFGTIHRKHASVHGVPEQMPIKGMGHLMQKELLYYDAIVTNPKRPFYAVIGGSKVSTKIPLIKGLLQKVDKLFISGAMCYTFFRYFGLNTGASLVEDGQETTIQEILDLAKQNHVELIYPEDIIVVENLTTNTAVKVVPRIRIPDGWIGVDHGPMTSLLWETKLWGAMSIFWNGPMGLFEKPRFAEGTRDLIKTLSLLTHHGVVTIVGGGDSLTALHSLVHEYEISHISTGGGSFLSMIGGESLPGLDILKED